MGYNSWNKKEYLTVCVDGGVFTLVGEVEKVKTAGKVQGYVTMKHVIHAWWLTIDTSMGGKWRPLKLMTTITRSFWLCKSMHGDWICFFAWCMEAQNQCEWLHGSRIKFGGWIKILNFMLAS